MLYEILDVLIIIDLIITNIVKTLVDVWRFFINFAIEVKNGHASLLIFVICPLSKLLNHFRFILLKNGRCTRSNEGRKGQAYS